MLLGQTLPSTNPTTDHTANRGNGAFHSDGVGDTHRSGSGGSRLPNEPYALLSSMPGSGPRTIYASAATRGTAVLGGNHGLPRLPVPMEHFRPTPQSLKGLLAEKQDSPRGKATGPGTTQARPKLVAGEILR